MAKRVCIPRNKATLKYAKAIDGIAQLKKEDERLRVDVWNFTPSIVRSLFYKSVSKVSNENPGLIASLPITKKLESFLKNVNLNSKALEKNVSFKKFKETVLDSDDIIGMSIALHEVMESVKGEYDKAVNLDIYPSEVSLDGVLPNLPLARVAESVGRKMAYQQGVVFTNRDDKSIDPEVISKMYYDKGLKAIKSLSGKNSYFTIGNRERSIKDYIDPAKGENSVVMNKNQKIVTNVKTLSINVEALGLDKNNIEEMYYFTNRGLAVTDASSFQSIVNSLKAVNIVTVGAQISLPNDKEYTAKQLREKDKDYTPDDQMNETKDALQNNPLKVNTVMHDFFSSIHKDVSSKGKPALDLLKSYLNRDTALLSSLFGIKQSDMFSRDKAESVTGQNISKTTPFNDFIEHYDVINKNGDSDIRLGLKVGRNARLYYWTSVLNPHASKHSRYTLTPGKSSYDVDTDSYKRIVSQISESLNVSPEAVMNLSEIENDKVSVQVKFNNDKLKIKKALRYLDRYKKETTAKTKVNSVAGMSKELPNVDFVSLVTGLQAIEDVRNPDAKGSITTEYAVSSDATASGGTLTLLQALGTNPEVATLLRRMSILGKGTEDPINDIYGVLQEAIANFVKIDNDSDLESSPRSGSESVNVSAKGLMEDLIGTVYKDVRALAKGPTMTFIYGQGEAATINSISTQIADDLFDNLQDPKVLKIIKSLVRDEEMSKDLNILSAVNIEGLYAQVVAGIVASQTPAKLFNLLEVNIKDKYFSEYNDRADNIYKLILDTAGNNFKVLPASAVMNMPKDTVVDPEYLDKYGIPISKIFDVANQVDGETIFTREQRTSKTVMGVSTTHGMDTAQLYNAIFKAVVEENNKTGVIVIHDDVRSNAEIVAKVEKLYISETLRLASEYDLHDQLLKSLIVYSPEISEYNDFKTLSKEVKESRAAKAEALKEFNLDTFSIIGDDKWTKVPDVSSNNTDTDTETENNTNVKSVSSTVTVAAQPKRLPVSKVKTTELDTAVVEVKRLQLEDAIKNNPDSIFVYDLETSGVDTKKSFIVEAGFKNGVKDSQSRRVILTQEQSETYVKDLKDYKSITDTELYKTIKANSEKNNDMADWNKTARPIDAVKKELIAASKGKYVVSFNGTTFDDEFMDNKITSSHDLRRLVRGTVNDLKKGDRKGKLTDYIQDAKNAHNAAVDVDLTYKLMQNFVDKDVTKANNNLLGAGYSMFKEKVEESPSFSAANLDALVKEFSTSSDIIKMYTDSANKAPIGKGIANTFDPDNDVIEISSVDPRNGDVAQNIDTKQGKANLKSLMEHEITHSFTVGFIQKALFEGTDNRVKYVQKAVEKMRVNLVNDTNLSLQAIDRMSYALIGNSEAEAVNEFIAIMTTEPDVAFEVYKSLGESRTKLQQAFDYIMKQGAKFVAAITSKDLENEYVDIAKLHGALNGVILDGYSLRENNREQFNEYQKTFRGKVGAGTTAPLKRHSLDYLNYAAATMINRKVERKLVGIVKNNHRSFSNNYPMYDSAMSSIYSFYKNSPALVEIMHTITNKDVNKKKKNDILSQSAVLQEERNNLIITELAKFKKLTSDLSKKDSNYLFNLINKTPLHDYFILASKKTTKTKILNRIKKLSNDKDIPSGRRFAIDAIVRNKINYEMQGKDDNVELERNLYYNLDGIINLRNTENLTEKTRLEHDKLREYMALKSIEALGLDSFVDMLKNIDLMDLVKDNAVANRVSTLVNDNTEKLNDSLIPEYYGEPMQTRTVTLATFSSFEFGNDTGWKVLRAPTDKTLGVVYRPVIDSTYLAGAFTDIKLGSSDIDVLEYNSKYSDVIRSGAGYKLILKDYEKDILGIVRDPAEALVRGTVHNLAVQDSQNIRDAMLQEETTHTVLDNLESKNDLDLLLDATNTENPWFIKIAVGSYNDMSDKVKQEYKPVRNRLSDVKGFDKEISLVRKDISHWLIGDTQQSLSNNPKLKWAIRITKQIVAGSKLGMVLLNPVKIAKDNASNLSYLGVMGVDPIFVGKSYKTIMSEFAEYTAIKQNVLDLKIKYLSQPKNVQLRERFDAQVKKLSEHRIDSVYKKGFVNSQGTELLHQNSETLDTRNSDLQTALSFMVNRKDGSNNALGKYLMTLSKLGFNGEDFLTYIGNKISSADSLKGVEKELAETASRISGIKNDNDAVNYISQFMITPNSESVKIGAYATDLSDVLAKETLYRYLTDVKKVSEEEATVTVIESFPDYKENMPMAIKQLSDMGILMFPSFWMRIQKVIYRMIRDKPVNLAVELQIENMVDKDLENIIDANVIAKYNEFGGLVHSPTELFGIESILPTNVYKYFF